MYHRVTEHDKKLARPTWNVTPKQFRAQLSGLLRLGYVPQPLSKVLEWNSNKKPIPNYWLVITFDDVYENVYTQAWPILRELQIPSTIFLATAYLDSNQPFPFDDWSHKCERDVSPRHWKPIRTWQCREMLESGLVEIGAHTHTHKDFRGRLNDFYDDLQICKNVLLNRFGVRNCSFAFPYGTRSLGFSSPELADVAKRAGLTCSLTTEDEQVISGTDPFDWGRFTAEQYDTSQTLAAKLSGWFTCFKALWNGETRQSPKDAQDLGIVV